MVVFLEAYEAELLRYYPNQLGKELGEEFFLNRLKILKESFWVSQLAKKHI